MEAILVWDPVDKVNTTFEQYYGGRANETSKLQDRDYHTCMRNAQSVLNCNLPGNAGTAASVIVLAMQAVCHAIYGI